MICSLHPLLKWSGVLANLCVRCREIEYFAKRAWCLHWRNQSEENPHPIQCKSVQASLFFILLLANSLSNTARSQLSKACPPSVMDFNFGKSSPQSGEANTLLSSKSAQ